MRSEVLLRAIRAHGVETLVWSGDVVKDGRHSWSHINERPIARQVLVMDPVAIAAEQRREQKADGIKMLDGDVDVYGDDEADSTSDALDGAASTDVDLYLLAEVADAEEGEFYPGLRVGSGSSATSGLLRDNAADSSVDGIMDNANNALGGLDSQTAWQMTRRTM